MAKMYKRQEKALKKWVDENQDQVWMFMAASDLPSSVYWEVYNMHPHETYDSNVERVISDHMIDNDIQGRVIW